MEWIYLNSGCCERFDTMTKRRTWREPDSVTVRFIATCKFPRRHL